MSARIKPHKVRAASSRRSERRIPTGGPKCITGRSIPSARCWGRARSRRRCTMPRRTSRQRLSSPTWIRSGVADPAGAREPGASLNSNERQFHARDRCTRRCRRWVASPARPAPASGTSSACSGACASGRCARLGRTIGAAGAGARHPGRGAGGVGVRRPTYRSIGFVGDEANWNETLAPPAEAAIKGSG